MVSSVARPVIELKERISKDPPATGRDPAGFFLFFLPSLLQAPDKDLRWVVEPGSLPHIMIGASSRDLRLKETLLVKP